MVMSWGISFDVCSYLLERNLLQIIVDQCTEREIYSLAVFSKYEHAG